MERPRHNSYKSSVIRRVESIVGGAEVRPVLCGNMSDTSKIYYLAALTRHGGNRSDIRDVLSQDDSKAGCEMPVDVTVKEPWTRIVGLHEYKLSARLSEYSINTHFEANRYVVSSVTKTYDVALYWVYIVVIRGTRRSDDAERMLTTSSVGCAK